jgi:hypothetical protein
MMHRKFAIVSTLVMLGIAVVIAGLVLYPNNTVRASAPSFPDALRYLPSDCRFVFGLNVQQLITNPAYVKMQQKHLQPIGKALEEFITKTGVDPRHDVFYLVAAGRSKERGKGEGVAIVVGKFNKDTIASYIRSKTAPIESEYGGVLILIMPKPQNNSFEKGIAFLSDREIALGDLESIKAVLDVKGKGNRNILSNPVMAPLINSISPDEMIWFAGDGTSLLAQAPVVAPFGANVPAVQTVVGTLNLTDTVNGKISATAADPASAAKLADVVKGFVAFGQLAGNQNPDLKILLSGLLVSQNATQVSVTLNLPIEVLDKLEQSKTQLK